MSDLKELNKEQSEIVQRHSEYMKSEVGYALALEECTDLLLDFHNEMNQANGATTGEKQCNLPVVVQQSELLSGFRYWYDHLSVEEDNMYEGRYEEVYLATL